MRVLVAVCGICAFAIRYTPSLMLVETFHSFLTPASSPFVYTGFRCEKVYEGVHHGAEKLLLRCG